MSFKSKKPTFCEIDAWQANLILFHDQTIFHHLCSKILPVYPTTRPGNVITRLFSGHLLPGPGNAKPSGHGYTIRYLSD